MLNRTLLLALAGATLLLAQDPPSPGEPQNKGTVYYLPSRYPAWPPAYDDKAYAAIDGNHLFGYVRELVGIADASHDDDQRYWGRIAGTDGDAHAANWMLSRLKQLGITDVHNESLDLPPQWAPQSWSVSATAGAKTVKLETATPMLHTPGTPNGAALDLEAIYVGLGTAADFAGRDVKGKAVFIQAEPLPGAARQSASEYGAPARAQEKGAAAIFIVIAVPGNFSTLAEGATTVPSFTLGFEDGAAVRELIEKGPTPRIKLSSVIKMESGLQTSLIWGVIPGMSDEKIIINAPRDGYYFGANDNASGVATALGLAEYYMKIPPEKRTRTIVIVGSPGHHNTPVGSQWLVAHKDTFFDKTALIINCENTAQASVDLKGFTLVNANTPAGFDWFVRGSAKLGQLANMDWDRFGVARYHDAMEVPSGDMSEFATFAPSVQLSQNTPFYHSDKDTLETIAPSGLGSVTRAYAHLIDDVNKLPIEQLQPGAIAPGSDPGEIEYKSPIDAPEIMQPPRRF